MTKQNSIKLNAYLLKDNYEFGDPVVAQGKLTESPVDVPNSGSGILYVKYPTPHTPGWAWFLHPIDNGQLTNLIVSSVSAILILRVDERFFAVCFGQGTAYLDKRFVESRFGLRACLNIVDPETIRFLDKRTFDSLGKLSHEQSTRPVTISEFGLEVDRDLLRSLVGTPRNPAFGKQIAGKDSICTSVSISLHQLPNLLGKCLKESKKDTYKENFEFVDNILEVSDPELIENLEARLVETINQRVLGKIWLAVPDIVKWEECAGFRYSIAKKEPISDDIRLRRYLDRWGLVDCLSIKKLKDHRIYQFGNDEKTMMNSWSVHHCLYAEISFDGRLYILTEGSWYNIRQDFVATVQETIDSIQRFEKALPVWGDEHEQHYNRRICDKSGGYYALMDRNLIVHGGGSSSIEFCDLLSTDHKIIHVKKYSGSSVLSHLFHQGTNSATMTAVDLEFRRKVNDKLPSTHKLPEDEQFQTSDYEVVFAVGTREPIGFQLPFFSKVSLRNAYRQLRTSGYRVSVATIKRDKLAKID